MFVQSERFVEAHGGQKTDISIFGQESNPTIWRLAQLERRQAAAAEEIVALPAQLLSPPGQAYANLLRDTCASTASRPTSPANRSRLKSLLLKSPL